MSCTTVTLGAALGLALQIVRDPALAEDAVQEAFLGVWRSAGKYDGSRAQVRTWIMAIVHHRSIDVVRKRRPESDLPTEGTTPTALVVPDVWPEVAAHFDSDMVRAALARLRPAQRQAIELAYFSGLTQEEIARQTEAPLGTVKSRVRLGLLAMRASIDRDAASRPVAFDADANGPPRQRSARSLEIRPAPDRFHACRDVGRADASRADHASGSAGARPATMRRCD